ncbi:MAG: hypothetical protein HQ519_01830 [Planctomycetes bacterium]|nr:hypothetical protein [Planctomycetota bacterium]
MQKLFRIGLISIVGYVWAAIGIAQQGPVSTPPEAYTVSPVDAWSKIPITDPRYHAEVEQSYRGEIETGQWLQIFEALARDSRNHRWSSNQDAQDNFQRQLDQLVDVMRVAYSRANLDGQPDTPAEISAIFDYVGLHHLGAGLFVPDEIVDPIAVPDPEFGDFFVASLFSGTGDLIYFTRAAGGDSNTNKPDDLFQLALTPDQILDLRLRADTVRFLLTKFINPVLQENVAAIHLAKRGWDNYLYKGYSQYPWEAALNGWAFEGSFSELHPPDGQWILLHPSLSLEADVSSLDTLQAKEVVAIELAGYLKYRGAERDNYFGGSLAMTLREQTGAGFGLMLHPYRNFSIGVIWHDLDGNSNYFDDNPSLLFSFDLLPSFAASGQGFADVYGPFSRKF